MLVVGTNSGTLLFSIIAFKWIVPLTQSSKRTEKKSFGIGMCEHTAVLKRNTHGDMNELR